MYLSYTWLVATIPQNYNQFGPLKTGIPLVIFVPSHRDSIFITSTRAPPTNVGHIQELGHTVIGGILIFCLNQISNVCHIQEFRTIGHVILVAISGTIIVMLYFKSSHCNLLGKTPSYGYRDPHDKPKKVWRPSQVYNGNPYTDKTVSS